MKQPSTVLVTYALPSSACCLQTAINQSSAKDVTLTVLIFHRYYPFCCRRWVKERFQPPTSHEILGVDTLNKGQLQKLKFKKITDFDKQIVYTGVIDPAESKSGPFLARPTPILSVWLFLVNTSKYSKKTTSGSDGHSNTPLHGSATAQDLTLVSKVTSFAVNLCCYLSHKSHDCIQSLSNIYTGICRIWITN